MHTAESKTESLEEEARQVVEEARMVLPGIQALFGFQLVAVFNQRYTELPDSEQFVHALFAGLVEAEQE